MSIRCSWVSNDPEYQDYHDKVWGVPELDSQQLFAKLCLEGQQAGLSWLTILKKQKGYEKAFFNFEPEKIKEVTEADIETILLDPGIVRNRLKVNAIVKNARAYLRLREQGIEFNDFIWQFVGGKTIINRWQNSTQVPASTPESDAMAKALKKAGFSFVGTTICYAFMQAAGLINDHTTDCFCYEKVKAIAVK